MKLGSFPTASCVGAILAHGERLGTEAPLKKGHVLTEDDVASLLAAGISNVTVAILEGGDVHEDEAAPRVAALVLAAGLSRRMGGANKLLADLEGVPVIARTVDALLASKAVSVLVVVGHDAELVRGALAGREIRFVDNADYEEGIGASLRAGARALDDGLDGVLVALGDMPWIRPSHVDALIEAFGLNGPHTICVPIHERKRGHPVLWSKRHFVEMRKLGGDIGARELLERHASSVLAVPVDDAAVHLDIDTPAMLDEARRRRA